MNMTSAYASKLIKKLHEDKEFWCNKERNSSTYIASLDEDPVVPDYDFKAVAENIAQLDEKIVRIKHALNVSNATNTVMVAGRQMTIDEILIRMAQYNRRKSILDMLRKNEPKTRIHSFRTAQSKAVPEYEFINYDLELVKAEYDRIDGEIAAMQIALDKYNQTVEFEVDC